MISETGMTAAPRAPADDVKPWFFRWEGPTWFLAAGIYAAWAGLVWYHAVLPWWVLVPVGAYIIGLHFSLQHEAIHGWRSCPTWLRTIMVWPPIGLWLPYEIYRRGHARHHRNADLTYPGKDTETYYHTRADWEAFSPLWRGLLMANQTFLGRVTVGPAMRLYKLFTRDLAKFFKGDFSDTGIWLLHIGGCAGVLWFVMAAAGMPWTDYLLLICLPGMMLSWVRPFLEHRWGDKPYHRVAAIPSNWFFGLLFLWNNIHIVHHLHPTMPWYEIPGYFRKNRDAMLAANGGYYISGYWPLVRDYWRKPAFSPIHPES